MTNTEVTLTTDGRSLAEMMGLAQSSSGKRSMLARFSQIHNPLKGDMEINGKTIRADVVPAGAYKLLQSDDKVAYSITPKIRIYAQRMQWTRWDSDENFMVKTVLVNSLNGDLKDNTGGFNAGRPSGYVEDFKSLPKGTQDLMRNTKRTKVIFGTVVMQGATDEQGVALSDTSLTTQEIPFVMDVKSRGSITAIDDIMKSITRKNALPLQYYLSMGAEMHEMPNGSEYATFDINLGDKVDISDSDKDVLDGFMDWISGMNNYINDTHNEKSGSSGMSSSAESIINGIVDIEVEV
jgi:hypothetical protein|tara:strand:- start:2095 stop:2976 length:882 start_codon:yes stop_codon:yes gene_type:complete